MKISHETRIAASSETLWKTLTDFSRYPEWNTILSGIKGEALPESALKVTLNLAGWGRRKVEAQVTGCIAPKYFSFESRHRFGEWFFHEEWIFRTKEQPDGVRFVAEVFVTGLGLRFRRAKVKNAFGRALRNLSEALKEKVELIPGTLEGAI
jgi:hypothetical protein